MWEKSSAEIITLRAIALKLLQLMHLGLFLICRDHNATSYSTETLFRWVRLLLPSRRDHNATSYSTETLWQGHCRSHTR